MFPGNILKCCTNALGQFFTFHDRFQNHVRTLFLPLLIWNLRKLCCKSCLFGQGTKVHLCFPMSNINLIFFNICAFNFCVLNIFNTRSYAALRAADLKWIVGPGYSLGGYILEKNHQKLTWNHEKP